jgi:hypothetical protein
MSAQIIPFPHRGPVKLAWFRHGDRRWQLVSVTGEPVVWASIEPYGERRGGRGMFALPTCKASALNRDLNEVRGREYWVLASTVTQAKHRIANYLRWAAAGIVEFEIAA